MSGDLRWPAERAVEVWSVRKGETFTKRLHWGTAPLRHLSITAQPAKVPLRFTVTSHGIPDGWPVFVAGHANVSKSAVYDATVIDADTISIPVDGSSFGTYAGGAFVVAPTPVNLSGYIARMHIRATKNAADPPLLALSTASGITIDAAEKFIEISMTAAETAAFTVRRAYADLEMVSGDVVARIADVKLRFVEEVTR